MGQNYFTKRIFLFLILLAGFNCLAQITLEHTYDYQMKRLNLEFSGEKYYYINLQAGTLVFYNADHTYWKTIALPLPANYELSTVADVSEHTINSDNSMEITYSLRIGGQYACRIASENGTVLMHEISSTIAVSRIEGLPNKILTDYAVRSLPSLTIEHQYGNTPVRRVKLENSGEKYYVLSNNSAEFYNADHTLWKTFSVPVESGYVQSLGMASETLFNADPMVEVASSASKYVGSGVSLFSFKVFQENGTILYSDAGLPTRTLDIIAGLPTKIKSHNWYNNYRFFIEPTTFTTVLAEQAFNMDRQVVDGLGEKYFSSIYTTQMSLGKLKIYNSDYTLFKTIQFPLPANTYFKGTGYYSKLELNDDEFIEFSYTSTYNGVSNSKIINELNYELLDVPYATSLTMSNIEGLQNKLIATLDVNGSQKTSIYGFVPTLGTHELFENEKVKVYPNPVRDVVYLDAKETIIQANVIDSRGVMIKQIKAENIKKIDVSNIGAGMYFLDLTSKNGGKSITKILIIK